jgi:hypothetical protein
MDTHAIGLALIVGGAAFLCSGLIFLLPTGRKLSSSQGSIEEGQEKVA